MTPESVLQASQGKRQFLISLIFTLLVVPLGAQPTLSAPDLNAEAGSIVAVAIQLQQGSELTGLQFLLEYDDSILSPLAEPVIPGALLSTHTYATGGNPGSLAALVFSAALDTFGGDSGTLLVVLFEVDSGADGGESSVLDLTNVKAVDPAGELTVLDDVDGSVTVSEQPNQASADQNELVFAQAANGEFGSGSVVVFLIFANRTASPAGAQLEFFQSDGSPFALELTNGQQGSSFTFTVPPGGSTFLTSKGTGGLTAGYARVNSTAPLGGTLLYSLRDAVGSVTTEAGVGASKAVRHFSIPVLFGGGADTGIAIANPLSGSADLQLWLKDNSGAIVQESAQNLAAGQHLAAFVSQFFDVLNGMPSFSGTMEITASAPVFAIALKQQGIILTTSPVVPVGTGR